MRRRMMKCDVRRLVARGCGYSSIKSVLGKQIETGFRGAAAVESSSASASCDQRDSAAAKSQSTYILIYTKTHYNL